uniref:SCO7613 C-terminal domain-containing membrane protein n=1 Tax=Cellulomonas hominis TaxID=156981 RepID=UPI001E3AEF83
AALAGAVRAAHLAASTPVAGGVANARLFGAALVWSLVGAVLLGALGRLLVDRLASAPAGAAPPVGGAAPWAAAPAGPDPRRAARVVVLRRWALAPALLAFTVGALVAVRPSWALTWTGWVVELGLLALAVAAVRSEASRSRGTLATDVPPGWVLWLAALAWAIGAWSPRELRVEVFALPLGLALTAMGWVALRAALADVTPRPGATLPGPGAVGAGRPGPWAVGSGVVGGGAPRPAWPVGRTTSLATLTPGILATLGPSILAIWTDPMTWRAILVVVLALGFMLEGAREMLRAPLVLGAGALPVAVLSVFAAQLGRTISAGPWLLTLLAAGGLLLVLGVFAERRRTAVAEGRATEAGVLR